MNLTACKECGEATFDAINGLCAECNASHLLPEPSIHVYTCPKCGDDYGTDSAVEPADCGEHKRVVLVGRIEARRLVMRDVSTAWMLGGA